MVKKSLASLSQSLKAELRIKLSIFADMIEEVPAEKFPRLIESFKKDILEEREDIAGSIREFFEAEGMGFTFDLDKLVSKRKDEIEKGEEELVKTTLKSSEKKPILLLSEPETAKLFSPVEFVNYLAKKEGAR